jgi:hypothetical protein
LTGRVHDDRVKLSAVPKLFDDLIQADKDPCSAVETVVALLAGEQS